MTNANVILQDIDKNNIFLVNCLMNVMSQNISRTAALAAVPSLLSSRPIKKSESDHEWPRITDACGKQRLSWMFPIQ